MYLCLVNHLQIMLFALFLALLIFFIYIDEYTAYEEACEQTVELACVFS